VPDEEALRILAEAAARSRGYADFFEWPDKRRKELGLLEALAAAMKDNGSLISDVQLEAEGQDPPDGWATYERQRVAIELTEFVDAVLIGQQIQEGVPQWRDWSIEEVQGHLRSIIRKKDHMGFGREIGYWLVIHCDEPTLTRDVMNSYLSNAAPIAVRGITKCVVLLSYDPNAQTYPLIEVQLRRSA
jgi:hypothetical protein